MIENFKITYQTFQMYGRTALRSSIYNMAIRHTQAKLPLQTRQSSSTLPNTLYQNVWRKSNVFYILYVVAGCIILEGVYGSVTTSIWDAVNKGVRNKIPFLLNRHYVVKVII